MLTTADKKYINETLITNNEVLVTEILELFNTTNKRIDDMNDKLVMILVRLDEHNDFLNDHERRIEKLEEKTSTTIPL